MKLSEFLKSDGINIFDNRDPQANEIKFNASHYVDLEKAVDDLTDDEIHQIFGHLIMLHNKNKAYSYYKIIELMKAEFTKVNNDQVKQA